jgi:hypothetical protein|tara:strand:- start:558 stop:962 length:405 start_codon:yes stop_codon:yes gene_type:complete
MTKVFAVSPQHLPAVWPKASEQIERANNISETGFTMDDLREKIADGRNQLWVIDNGAASAITSVVSYPQHKCVKVTYLGGDNMKDWFVPFVEKIEEFGRSQGCKFIETAGRKGWERMCKPLGAKLEFIVLRKAL